jgi:hypothetical protein
MEILILIIGIILTIFNLAMILLQEKINKEFISWMTTVRELLELRNKKDEL